MKMQSLHSSIRKYKNKNKFNDICVHPCAIWVLCNYKNALKNTLKSYINLFWSQLNKLQHYHRLFFLTNSTKMQRTIWYHQKRRISEIFDYYIDCIGYLLNWTVHCTDFKKGLMATCFISNKNKINNLWDRKGMKRKLNATVMKTETKNLDNRNAQKSGYERQVIQSA